jgi:hypothetical protein
MSLQIIKTRVLVLANADVLAAWSAAMPGGSIVWPRWLARINPGHQTAYHMTDCQILNRRVIARLALIIRTVTTK